MPTWGAGVHPAVGRLVGGHQDKSPVHHRDTHDKHTCLPSLTSTDNLESPSMILDFGMKSEHLEKIDTDMGRKTPTEF